MRRRVFVPITARPYEVISLDPKGVSPAGFADVDLSSRHTAATGRDTGHPVAAVAKMSAA
jgi:hypothetical protein